MIRWSASKTQLPSITLSFDTSKVNQMTSIFSGAKVFNQPLAFNTAQVTQVRVYFELVWLVSNRIETRFLFSLSHPTYHQMSQMFWDATAFNQDLCHFRDNLSQISVSSIFLNSGCSNKNPPTSAKRLWCAVTTCP